MTRLGRPNPDASHARVTPGGLHRLEAVGFPVPARRAQAVAELDSYLEGRPGPVAERLIASALVGTP